MLLAIDILQPQIITYLLERLPEFYDELENEYAKNWERSNSSIKLTFL